MNNSGIAGALSFVIPGAGQIFNGNYFWAIFWMIIAPGMWIASAGFFGWIIHLICSYAAYSTAKENELNSSNLPSRSE